METSCAQRLKSIVSFVRNARPWSNIEMDGPDGGRAWIVALAACTINFIMSGLSRVAGILFVAFIEIFGVDRMQASTPFSVRSSTRNLLGPIVGILGQKYGIRLVVMIGGAVSTISAAFCFFADDITWMTFLWGGLNGVGTALTVILPQVAIGQHFDVYRTTASGMAFSGGCFGSFVFPSLIEYLIQEYGIGGTFLILAGIIANTIPAAMILRKPSWMKSMNKDYVELSVSETISPISPCKKEIDGSEFRKVGKGTYSKQLIDEISKDCPDIKFLRQNNELIMKMLKVSTRHSYFDSTDNQMEYECSLDFRIWSELEDILNSIEYPNDNSRLRQNLTLIGQRSLENLSRKESLKPKTSLNPQSNRVAQSKNKMLQRTRSVPVLSETACGFPQTIFGEIKYISSLKLSEALNLFPKENRCIVLKALRELKKLNKAARLLKMNNESTPKVEHTFKQLKKEVVPEPHSGTICDHIKAALKLHGNPVFMMICFCRAIHFVAFIPAMTIIVDFFMDKGFLEEDGKNAILVVSLGDLIGRLGLGWVTDKGFLTLPHYMMVVMIAQGASTAFLPLMHTRLTLFAMLVVFGMLQGSLFVRHSVLVSNYMDPNEQSIAMGCTSFFSGLVGFGVPAYIGFFRDAHDSYDFIFYINGALGALVGLLWIFEPFFRKNDKDDDLEIDMNDSV